MIRLLFLVGLFILLGCKHQEARRPVAQTQTDRFEKSIERNKQRYADEVKAIQSIIDDLPNSTFKPSESGFWYSVIYNPKKNNYQSIHLYVLNELLIEIQIRDIYMHNVAINGTASNYY